MLIKPIDRSRNLAAVGFAPHHVSALQSIPGYSRWDQHHFVFRPTRANIQHILERCPEALWLESAQWHKEQVMGYIRKRKKPSKMNNYKYKRSPMAHQEQAFQLSCNEPIFGLFMEQGTGKTKITLDTACHLYAQKKIDMLMIIAWPNGVHANWIDYEVPADVPDWCQHTAFTWRSSMGKKQTKKLQDAIDDKSTLRIIAFNIEAVASKTAKHYMAECVSKNKCMVVIDQSASIKNPAAKRTQFILRNIAPHAQYKRILDGAPVAEGAEELYCQFRFLDENIIGHDTWTGFKAEFCRLGRWNEVVGYRNLDRLHERIDAYSYRVLAKDCITLPPRVYKRWGFYLGPTEQRIFDQLRKKNIAYFSTTEVKGELNPKIEERLAMVKNLRLQQVSSGWFPMSNGYLQNIGDNTRINALLELLKQAEGKALIYSRFVADLEAIQKALGDKAVSYHGGINNADRAENKRAFMENEAVRYFIGQPQAAGLGHTLTAAKHVVFYSNDPSLRLREECEKRAHRKGIENTLKAGEHLIIWDLVAKGTQDARIISALRRKKNVSDEIMKDPESFFLLNEV